MRPSIVLRVALGGLSLVGAGPAWSQSDVARGGELYVRYGCAQCHNINGQGGQAGPRLAPDTHEFEAFEAMTRFPVMRMPAYTSEQLSQPDLRAIHAYLTSQRQPPPLARIPLLSERARAITTK